MLDCHNVQPRARTRVCVCVRTFRHGSNLLGQSGTEGILLPRLMGGQGLLRACFGGPVLQDLMHFCRKNRVKRRKRRIIHLSGCLCSILLQSRANAAQQLPLLRNNGLFERLHERTGSPTGQTRNTCIYLRIRGDVFVLFQCCSNSLRAFLASHPRIPKLSPNDFWIVQSLK